MAKTKSYFHLSNMERTTHDVQYSNDDMPSHQKAVELLRQLSCKPGKYELAVMTAYMQAKDPEFGLLGSELDESIRRFFRITPESDKKQVHAVQVGISQAVYEIVETIAPQQFEAFFTRDTKWSSPVLLRGRKSRKTDNYVATLEDQADITREDFVKSLAALIDQKLRIRSSLDRAILAAVLTSREGFMLGNEVEEFTFRYCNVKNNKRERHASQVRIGYLTHRLMAMAATLGLQVTGRPTFHSQRTSPLEMIRVVRPFEVSNAEADQLISEAFTAGANRRHKALPSEQNLNEVRQSFKGEEFPFAKSILSVDYDPDALDAAKKDKKTKKSKTAKPEPSASLRS